MVSYRLVMQLPREIVSKMHANLLMELYLSSGICWS